MNKHKIIIILFFMGLSLFFINPIDAQVVNGYFTNNTLDGWYRTEHYSASGYKAVVDTQMHANGRLSQMVDFTYWDTLHYKVRSTNSQISCDIIFGPTNDHFYISTETAYSMDVSGVTGIKQLQFHSFRDGPGTISVDNVYLSGYNPPYSPTITGYVKDVNNQPIINSYVSDNLSITSTYTDFSGYYCLTGYSESTSYLITATKDTYDYNNIVVNTGIGVDSTGNDITLTKIPSYINFVPDILETSTWPLNITLSVNDTCNGLNQVYVYQDDYRILTYSISTQDTSFSLSDLTFPCDNSTYKIELLTLPCGVINTDSISFLIDDSIDPYPDPDPTPDITPLPTYTPPPTPIPPDNPITPNNTLNTSWYQGYISLVDSCINGLFSPIYNATAHFMYPTIVLTTTGASLMIESEIIFAIVTEKILIATSMMEVFFNCLPDKLIYVMIYYLLWLVILLVFKGAA